MDLADRRKLSQPAVGVGQGAKKQPTEHSRSPWVWGWVALDGGGSGTKHRITD